MRNVLATMLLAVVSPLVAAADWQYTTQSSSGDLYHMDFDSVANVGKHRKAWMQISLESPAETEQYPKKKYHSTRMLYYFDCQSRQMGVVHTVKYEEKFAKGNVVDSYNIKFTPSVLSDVVPDTVGETILKTACAPQAERVRIKANNAALVAALIKQLEQAEEAPPEAK